MFINLPSDEDILLQKSFLSILTCKNKLLMGSWVERDCYGGPLNKREYSQQGKSGKYKLEVRTVFFPLH